MDKISLTDKYRGVDIKKVVEKCKHAHGLYEGNWVSTGPEEGAFNETNEWKDRAIDIVKLLYPLIEPYKEQIRADYQNYKQLDLWERDRVYEDGWELGWLDWACEFYDTHIDFMDKLRANQQPQQAPAVGKPQHARKLKKEVPDVLTPKVLRCLEEAIEKGWMLEINKGNYEWLGIDGNKQRGYLQQLAFFCGYMYRVEDWVLGVKRTNMPTRELEQIFGVKGLSKKINKFHADWLPKWSPAIITLVNSVEASK